VKLLDNLYKTIWAIIQWLIVIAMFSPILACGSILGLVGVASAFGSLGWWSIAVLFAYVLFFVTCWTYRKSGFFWATMLPKMGDNERE